MYYSNGLVEGVLPVPLRPQADELLTSWLIRLAMAHGLKLHTFCTLLWGKRAIWNRDIDKCADDPLLEILCQRTRTSQARARQTTLAAYEGVLYERHNSLGNSLWVMPLGIYHRVRRLHGTQYCPQCLTEDKEPYFRRSWRLAFVTLCTEHRCMLFDSCPRCDVAINFHRDELGERSKQVATGMTRCFSCKFDLRSVCSLTPKERLPVVYGDHSIGCQIKLTEAVKNGWIDLGGERKIYSLLYFPVLRQIMKLLASHRGIHLLTALCREVEAPLFTPSFPAGRKDVESLRVEERHQLKTLALYLLDDWDHRFVRICSAGRAWSSTLLRDFKGAPFWYWRVIHDHLYKMHYSPSAQEIQSVVSSISKSGTVPCKAAVSKQLGMREAFRKRTDGLFRQ